ncbi:MAG: YbaN family protein [Eubacterium sp.]|nr:YbaN family protein [Eubacterium sp.]
MKIKKIIFIVLGCVCLALGCIGIVLPILPTVPFFLVTVFCFANSSEKLHKWFTGTKMYKKHLESFVKKKGMTLQTKLTIISSVTLLMGFGFFMMFRKAIYIPCIILGVVWLCHIIYFIFGVKTIKKIDTEEIYSD